MTTNGNGAHSPGQPVLSPECVHKLSTGQLPGPTVDVNEQREIHLVMPIPGQKGALVYSALQAKSFLSALLQIEVNVATQAAEQQPSSIIVPKLDTSKLGDLRARGA